MFLLSFIGCNEPLCPPPSAFSISHSSPTFFPITPLSSFCPPLDYPLSSLSCLWLFSRFRLGASFATWSTPITWWGSRRSAITWPSTSTSSLSSCCPNGNLTINLNFFYSRWRNEVDIVKSKTLYGVSNAQLIKKAYECDQEAIVFALGKLSQLSVILYSSLLGPRTSY